jgi:glycosyltransferase involved in cell wall biosynthesis
VRSLFDCLLDAGVTPELIDVSPSVLEKFDQPHIYSAFESSRPNASVVIFCMPFFEMMRIICTLGLTTSSQQYWIGYWPWETTALNPGWIKSFEFVNEVWASSRFLYETYSKHTKKPVFHVPLNVCVPVPMEPEEIGSLFGAKFTFLSVFDFNSRIERKNPIGAISAFRRAFPKKTEHAQLVLKTIHGDLRSDEFDVVRAAMDEDERIVLLDGALSREEVCWPIQNSNVYLSLHRSEGFGRPIAEAMLLGTPVIATGWSGNTDFLSEETGFPIKYRLRAVHPSEYPFAAGEWAEPDLEHAADVMRRLYQSGGPKPGITLQAKRLVTKLFSRPSTSAKLVERLIAISHAMKSGDQSSADKSAGDVSIIASGAGDLLKVGLTGNETITANGGTEVDLTHNATDDKIGVSDGVETITFTDTHQAMKISHAIKSSDQSSSDTSVGDVSCAPTRQVASKKGRRKNQ